MPHGVHLYVVARRWLRSKLALHAKLRLRDPPAQEDERVDDTEDDDDADGDADDVGGNVAAPADGVVVEEAVRVEVLVGEGDVRDGQVAEQQGEQPDDVDGRRRRGARDDELEEGEERVEGVLADVVPGVELAGEPGRLVQHGPVDDGDEEGEGDDAGVEERVQGLQRARQAVEQRAAGEGVGEGVQRGGEEVEGEAPVGEDGEVGEGLADDEAAAEGGVGAGPADDEEEGGEGVDALGAVSYRGERKGGEGGR